MPQARQWPRGPWTACRTGALWRPPWSPAAHRVSAVAEDKAVDTATDQPGMSYEQARDELTEVVRRLESGGLTLAESLQLWERGEKLAATCETWLEGARARLSTAMAERTGPEPAEQDAETPF